jgi:hypothetical protein
MRPPKAAVATVRSIACLLVLLSAASVCEPPPDGVVGQQGKALFRADDEAVLTTRLARGSSFSAVTLPKAADGDASAWSVRSSDDAVFSISDVAVADNQVGFRLSTVGSGRANIEVVQGSDVVDVLAIDVATSVNSTLADQKLLTSVDPRLPEQFAVLVDEPVTLLVAGADSCGSGVLDVGASTVTVEPADAAVITNPSIATFVVQATQAGAFTLALRTPGSDEDLVYRVQAVVRDDVDEVRGEAHTIDTNTAAVSLWGRAFVNDVDVAGLDFDWRASARVSLAVGRGPDTIATIALPAEGQTDDRPAVVTTEVFGVAADTDLLAISNLVGSRGDVHQRPQPPPTNPEGARLACGEGSGCTPALLGPCLLVWQRRRRGRQRSNAHGKHHA